MKSDGNLEEKQYIRQYLLGGLGEEEQAKVQDRLVSDREFLNRLETEENELTDDYLRGALTSEERERYKNYFLAAPEHRQKLRFAKAFRKGVSEAAREKSDVEPGLWRKYLSNFTLSPFVRYSVAAVVLLVLMAGAWLIRENAKLRDQLGHMQAEQTEWLKQAKELERQLSDERRRSEELVRELEGEKEKPEAPDGSLSSLKPPSNGNESQAKGRMVSFVLMPGLVREGDKTNRLQIPTGTGQIRLQLNLEKPDYRTYRAELRTAEGGQVWSRGDLEARQTKSDKQVVISLPAKILTRNDYILMLRGATAGGDYERAGTYYFRVFR